MTFKLKWALLGLFLLIPLVGYSASCKTVQIVKFTASWCGTCKTMEREVFSDNQVKNKLSTFKFVDVADYDTDRKYAETFSVQIVPTIIFLGANGKEIRGTRITGGMSRDGFLNHLSGVCQ